MKVAIPVWQSRISPVFDVARRLLVLDVDNGREISRSECFMDNLSSDSHARVLIELNIDVLLCGAISRHLANEIMASGIEIVSLLTGPVEELLGHYIAKKPLEAHFLMPGRRACRHRFRGSRGRKHGERQQQNTEDAERR